MSLHCSCQHSLFLINKAARRALQYSLVLKLKLIAILVPNLKKKLGVGGGRGVQPENYNPGEKKQTTCKIPDGNRQSFVPADFFYELIYCLFEVSLNMNPKACFFIVWSFKSSFEMSSWWSSLQISWQPYVSTYFVLSSFRCHLVPSLTWLNASWQK